MIFIAIIALTLVASSTNLAFCLRGPRGLAFLNSQECYHFLVCDRHHNRFLYGLDMFECIFYCFSWFHDSHVTAGLQKSTILRIPSQIMNKVKKTPIFISVCFDNAENRETEVILWYTLVIFGDSYSWIPFDYCHQYCRLHSYSCILGEMPPSILQNQLKKIHITDIQSEDFLALAGLNIHCLNLFHITWYHLDIY